MQEVIFSDRAYIAILKETQVHISTETGGIFLGRVDGNKWYILESLDPGPKSVFLTTYFEYDHKYLEHLISKTNYLYEKPLRILGLWHRHPGAFNVFSSTDDGTNYKFAQLNKEGAISALINLEPETTLTVYHVESERKNVVYEKVKYQVGDDLIPQEYRCLASAQKTLEEIKAYQNGTFLRGLGKKEALVDFNQIVKAYVDSREEISHKERTVNVLSDIDLENLLELLDEDFEYFSENAVEYKLKRVDSCLHLIVTETATSKEIDIAFIYEPTTEKSYVLLNGKTYEYETGGFKHSFLESDGKKKNIGRNLWQRITKEIKYLFRSK